MKVRWHVHCVMLIALAAIAAISVDIFVSRDGDALTPSTRSVSLTSNTFEPVSSNTSASANRSGHRSDECEWYHNGDWWSVFNASKQTRRADILALDAAYNYSIPMRISNDSIRHHTRSNVASNSNDLRSALKDVQCEFQGKVFNIGVQKTGTTTMAYILNALKFDCNRIDGFERYGPSLRKTCTNHPANTFYRKSATNARLGLIRWRPFSADDISDVFANTNYTKQLYLSSRASQIFADSPWCFLFLVWDHWYPSNAKYILTLRRSTYHRVNSAVKFELQMRARHETNMSSVYWHSAAESRLFPQNQLEQFAVLMARLYEKHNQNVLSYFGADRIGHDIDSDLLVLCLDCEPDPWPKITSFLGCSMDSPFPPFAHELRSALPSVYVPRNFSLDWKSYQFTPFVEEVLRLIYDQNQTERERMHSVVRKLWGFDIQTQSNV